MANPKDSELASCQAREAERSARGFLVSLLSDAFGVRDGFLPSNLTTDESEEKPETVSHVVCLVSHRRPTNYQRGEDAAGNGNRMFALASGEVITDQNVRTVAKTLPYIGEGVSRTVYDLGDVVLKVDSGGVWAGNCESEVECWNEYEGTEHEHLFARVLASGRGWIIAEKCESVRDCYSSQVVQDVIRQLEWLGIGDLHPGNLGLREDGSACAIDYAMNEHRYGVSQVSDAESESECECAEHDCGRCYPDGCECCCDAHNWEGCETFQGCRKEECDDCYATADYHWQETFGFLRGVVTVRNGNGMVKEWEHRHACKRHVPASRKTQDPKPQMIGQRGLRIWNGMFLLPWEG